MKSFTNQSCSLLRSAEKGRLFKSLSMKMNACGSRDCKFYSFLNSPCQVLREKRSWTCSSKQKAYSPTALQPNFLAMLTNLNRFTDSETYLHHRTEHKNASLGVWLFWMRKRGSNMGLSRVNGCHLFITTPLSRTAGLVKSPSNVHVLIEFWSREEEESSASTRSYRDGLPYRKVRQEHLLLLQSIEKYLA